MIHHGHLDTVHDCRSSWTNGGRKKGGTLQAFAGCSRCGRPWCRWDRPMRSVIRGHDDMLKSIALSADGQFLAAGYNDLTVVLANASHGTPIRSESNAGTDALAFSPCGRWLASGAFGLARRVHQAQSHGRIKVPIQLSDHPCGASLFPGWRQVGRCLPVLRRAQRLGLSEPDWFCKGSSSTVRMVREFVQYDEAADSDEDALSRCGPPAEGVVWSPDGERMRRLLPRSDGADFGTHTPMPPYQLCGQHHCRNRTRWLDFIGLSIRRAKRSMNLPTNWMPSRSLRKRTPLGCRGRRTMSRSGIPKTGPSCRPFAAPGGNVPTLAFSADGELLFAMGQLDEGVNAWRVETGQQVTLLRGHEGFMRRFTVSADGKWLASSSFAPDLIVWNTAEIRPQPSLQGHTYFIDSWAFSPDGGELATISDDRFRGGMDARPGTRRIWDSLSGVQKSSNPKPKRYTSGFVYSLEGWGLYWLDENRRINVWEVSTGRERVGLLPSELPLGATSVVMDGTWCFKM